MANEKTWCTCGHLLVKRDDTFVCTICHSVFVKKDGTYSFAGNTAGIRETRELLDHLDNRKDVNIDVDDLF